jgi:hypothetical protein
MFLFTNEEKAFCVLAGLVAVVSFAAAQDMSIEESYLQRSVEMMIIREQAVSNDRDTKLSALEYIKQLIDSGNTSAEVREVLSNMALEGILNKTRSDGRTINNFPDIRIKAVEYLGDIKDKESTDTLLRVLFSDNEPSVVTMAVRSLTKHGLNDDGYSLNAILYVFMQYNSRMPSNVLALSVIDSCNSFAENNENKNTWVYSTLLGISKNHSYVKYVRDYAGKTLEKIYKQNSK